MTTTPPEPPGPPSDGDDNRPPVPPGPGGSSAPPPPPPPGYGEAPGYGGAPGYQQPAYAGAAGYGAANQTTEPGFADALAYGWAKFQQNVSSILVAILIYLVAFLVVGGILFAIVILPMRNSADGFGGALLVAAVQTIIFGVVGYLIQAGFVRGALAITRGEKPTLNTFLDFTNVGQVLLAALIISVASGIGTLLCYLPGIAVSYLAQFTLFYVIDRNLGAVDAIKASIQLTTQHLGVLIVFSIIAGLILVAAAVLCVLPLLVAFPVVLIAQAYLYRRLQGEAVAA
jgi:uncharacterized membrane protein